MSGRLRLSFATYATVLAVLLASVLFAAGCTTSEETRSADLRSRGGEEPPETLTKSPASVADPSASEAHVDAPFDVGGVVDQVRNSFRAEGGRFLGGRDTYRVHVESDAAFSVTPVHAPNGRPADARSAQPRRDDPDADLGAGSQSDERIEGASAVLQTTSVRRARTEFAHAPESTVAEDGHLEISRGEVVEHLRNSDEGVEQSWSFAARPGGKGDLVVEVDVDGQDYVGATEYGLHFADAHTGLGVRYGHATWIGADGVETRLAARWSGEAIELRVPEELVDRSSYPAVLDPVISPEFGMDDPVWVRNSGVMGSPSVAHDGTNYLVVWSEQRDGNQSDVLGVQVDGTGTVIDPPGFQIASAPTNERYPEVAHNGDIFLVVWDEGRNANGDIYGARVDASGGVLDPTGFAISIGPDHERRPSVASDGRSFMVTWRGNQNADDSIYAREVKAYRYLGPQAVVSSGTGHRYEPSVAFDGTNYFVVWHDYRNGDADIYGARLDPSGSVLDPTAIAISTAVGNQSQPAVAHDGTNVLVAWQDLRSTDADIYGARVDGAGVVLDPNGIVISSAAGSQYAPAVAADGNQSLVVWIDGRAGGQYDGHTYGARVDSTGNVRDPAGVQISNSIDYERSPSVAYDGTNFLVVWESNTIYGARVDGAGSVLDPSSLIFSTRANAQNGPSVAYDGTNYLVVWSDDRNDSIDIYGVRVSDTGSLLEPSGIAISVEEGTQHSPSVAHDGTNFFVVWSDGRESFSNRDIYGARVDASGSVLDLGGIEVSAAGRSQDHPAVSHDGTNFLVVWMDERNGDFDFDVYGARVDAAGSVLDPTGIAISTAADDQRAPSVSHDGTNSFVVWTDRRNGDADIYGARVDAAGSVLDPTGIAVSSAANHQTVPSVASDGTNFLVVWQDSRNGQRIYSARVDATAGVLDPSGVAISAPGTVDSDPSVVYDGSQFFVAWYGRQLSQTTTLLAARIDAAGTVRDPAGATISTSIGFGAAPALASKGPEQFFIAYRPSGPRVRARLVSFNEPPVAEDQSVTVDEDLGVAIALVASDADRDALTYVIDAGPTHGTLSHFDASTGTLTYVPDANFNGTDSFSFKTNDATVDSNTATVSITVSPVNDAPIFVSAPVATAIEDQTYGYSVEASDVEADALTISAPMLPAWLTLTDHGDGTASIDGTPSNDNVGAHAVELDASDGDQTTTQSFEIVVVNVNDAPVFVAPTPDEGSTLMVAEGAALSLVMKAEDDDGDSLRYSASPLPAGAVLDAASGVLSWTPSWADEGDHPVTLAANDGLASDTRSVTIAVSVTDDDDDDTPDDRDIDSDGDGVADGDDDCPLLFGESATGCARVDDRASRGDEESGCGCSSTSPVDLPGNALTVVLLGSALALLRRCRETP